jgi:hypothetical protein
MGHTTLRRRLNEHPDLSEIIVSTFLQGSYRRATAIKPKNGKRADVDIIVVTNLDRYKLTPKEAIDKFLPFVEKYYKGKYEIQGRSIGIELSYVDLDIVITSAPLEADRQLFRSKSVTSLLALDDLQNDWKLDLEWVEPEHRAYLSTESSRQAAEWKSSTLYIPDREADCWVETNPLEQIRWTRDKNRKTTSHYINVVKALKWWRISKLTNLKYPKGYPIEHMIGDCCPDGIGSVVEGVVLTLEAIVNNYAWRRSIGLTPNLPDRGVESHNVWKRVSNEDFVAFYDYAKEAAQIARKAFDSELICDKLLHWQSLLGAEFPVMSEEQARNERLERKSKLLGTGQITIGKDMSLLSGVAGIKVPLERDHYDDSNQQK